MKMILSEKIIMLRKKYGWSQEELAERLTFPDSLYPNGRVEPQSRIWNALSV